jgi:hypothetical protein
VSNNKGTPVKKTTRVGYGVNKDEFTDEVEAWVSDAGCGDDCGDGKPLVTTFKGLVAETKEKKHYLDLTVSSAVEEKGFITYRITLGEKTKGMTVSLDKVGPTADQSLVLNWIPARTKPFIQEATKQNLDFVKPGPKNSFVLRISAKQAEVREGLLEILAPDGKTRIFATNAPVYVP